MTQELNNSILLLDYKFMWPFKFDMNSLLCLYELCIMFF
jgi:hypothetical protein